MMLKESDSSLNDGISVIICCYNSAWVIERSLSALKCQVFSNPVSWEVMLVDNNCTDGTVEISNRIMSDSDVDFRVVNETKAGLSYARKKGINTIKYRYCIYCDDDNLLSSNYVEYMYNLLRSNSEIGAAGGKGIPEFECDPDQNILNYLTGYAVGSQLEHPDFLFGAGLAMRSEVVKHIYNNFPNILVGRKGGVLLAGDDLELINYVKLLGYTLYPTDDVSYVHVLKANRLTEEYRKKLYEGLMLALPVGDMMTKALNNEPVLSYFITYYKSIILLSIGSLLRCSEKDLIDVKKFVERIDFWGVCKLYTIYKTCLKIKQYSGKNRFLS